MDLSHEETACVFLYVWTAKVLGTCNLIIPSVPFPELTSRI